MEYKAIVVRDGTEGFYLFFEQEPGIFSDGIPITDAENVYQNLTESNINFCKVKFCDGTEPKPFDSFENIEEVFFEIKDIAVIVMCDKEGNDVSALKALEEEGQSLMTAFFAESVFNS